MNELIARFNKAVDRKQPWLGMMEEAYHYSIPNRNDFFDKTKGSKKNQDVYDSTAVVGVQRFATRIQSILVPPWRRWTTLVSGNAIPEDEREDVNRILANITEEFFRHLDHSNFAVRSHESFQDLGVSTGALLFHEGKGTELFTFSSIPLSSLYLEEGPDGEVQTVWRKLSVSIRNIPGMWKDVRLTDTLKDMLSTSPDKEVELIEGTIYNGKDYDYVVLFKEAELVRRSFEISPWIVFRWSTIPGEVYGRGPVLTVLPDILTLNKVREYVLLNGAMNIAGMYTARNDGVLNPYTVEFAPNTILPVASNDRNNPSIRALEQSGNFDLSQIIISDLQTNVKKALFVDQLGPVDGAVRSATEISVRNQELLQDIGGSFGRLQTEMVTKIVNRGVHILQKAGKIPNFRIDGEEVSLRHQSPLAKAQDQEDVLAFQQFLEIGGALGPEVMMLGTKVEDAPSWLARKLGLDPELIRSEGERMQMQQQAAAAAAQQAVPSEG